MPGARAAARSSCPSTELGLGARPLSAWPAGTALPRANRAVRTTAGGRPATAAGVRVAPGPPGAGAVPSATGPRKAAGPLRAGAAPSSPSAELLEVSALPGAEAAPCRNTPLPKVAGLLRARVAP